ncbi:hypothetical protein ACIQ7S_28110 [Streptomyces griseoluteus]|uniref:hypothetical protein n=1 Tax=Streptomyces griseoluteus TaxID=29306 RepID=UPI00332E0C8D
MAYLIVVLFAAALAGWAVYARARRFPGSLALAVLPRHAEDRRPLAQARANVRSLEEIARSEESAARAEVARQEQKREQDLRAAARRVASLEKPGRGKRLGALGELTLYEHVLVKRDTNGATRNVHLADRRVRIDAGDSAYYLYVLEADGTPERTDYPRRTGEGEEAKGFTEDRVRDFADAVRRAVARENAFRAALPERLKQAQHDRELLEQDTEAVDRARERHAGVRARNKDNRRLAEARAELEAARLEWRRHTGRMPPP